MNYPFHLEWMEPAMVDHVVRVLSGQMLYARPNLDFTANIYPPVYFYVAAVFSKILGIGFLPLRLTSFVASLGTIVLIYLFVLRETGRRFPAFVAAGLFAATYRLSGAWMDVARVDSLFLLVTLAALYFIRFHPTVRGYLLAGVLAAIAVHTKQTAFLILAPAVVWTFRKDWKLGILLLAVGGGLGLLVYLALNHAAQGWYGYYYSLPLHHSGTNHWMIFWKHDMLPAGAMLLLFLSFIVGRSLRSMIEAKHLFYLVVGLAMLAASYMSRMHLGGFQNVLLPVYAALAIVSGLAIDRFCGREGGRWSFSVPVLLAVVVGQFVLLYRNPMDQVPTREDREVGRAYVEMLRGYQAPVYMITDGGYYNRVLGYDATFAGASAVMDVVRTTIYDRFGITRVPDDIKNQFIHEAVMEFKDQRFKAIVSNKETVFSELLEGCYKVDREISYEGDAFYPVTGRQVRPELIWVPRERINPVLTINFPVKPRRVRY